MAGSTTAQPGSETPDEAQLLRVALAAERARSAATADILRAFIASPGDPRPISALIARKAAELCEAAFCILWRVKDGHTLYCASHGFDAGFLAALEARPPAPLDDSPVTGRVVGAGRIVWMEDATDESYHDHAFARRLGLRQFVGVPVPVGGAIWGTINLASPEGRTARNTHISLAESFAIQASIAIGNAILFDQTQQSLVRETASAEIPGVISRPVEATAPVCEAILSRAAALCGAPMVSLNLVEDDRTHARFVAHVGNALRHLKVGETLWPLDSGLGPAEAIRLRKPVHNLDLKDTDRYRAVPSWARKASAWAACSSPSAGPTVRPRGNTAAPGWGWRYQSGWPN